MICVVVGGTPLASAQEGATRYVVADVMRVRAAPVKGAKVIANLRIATPVKIAPGGAAPEGWSKVVLDTDPPLTGYLASAFLASKPPQAADLLARYEAAMAGGNLDDAKTAAERLVALEPGRDEHLERLKAIYVELGDTDGALRIDSHLKGAGIKHIGLCGGPLLASYQPGGGLTNWVVSYFFTAADVARLPALRLGLQRSPWFVFDSSVGRSDPLPVTYMLNARNVQGNADEAKAGEKTVGPSLNLAGCGKNRGIVSNEPMEPVTFEEADRSRVEEFIANEVARAQDKYKNEYNMGSYSVGSQTARAIPGPRRLLTIRAETSETFGGSVWRLYDATTGERLAGAGGGSTDGTYFYATVRGVTWFKWRGSEAHVAIVDYYVTSDASDNGGYVDIVVVEEDKTVRKFQLRLSWTKGG